MGLPRQELLHLKLAVYPIAQESLESMAADLSKCRAHLGDGIGTFLFLIRQFEVGVVGA